MKDLDFGGGGERVRGRIARGLGSMATSSFRLFSFLYELDASSWTFLLFSSGGNGEASSSSLPFHSSPLTLLKVLRCLSSSLF